MVRPLACSTPDGRGAKIVPVHHAVLAGAAGQVSWHVSEADLDADRCALMPGELVLELVREDHGDAATILPSLHNAGARPLRVEALELGLRFSGHGHTALRFLRNGWQSWSFTGTQDLDEAGTPPFPSGAWLRGMHHCLGEPGERRAGWHESASLTAVGPAAGGPAAAVGVLETGRAFGLVYLRPEPASAAGERPVRIDVEIRAEVELAPGAHLELEAVRVALGDDPGLLLERLAELWGRVAGARRDAGYQAGWCSWYHFFHAVTEDDLLRNLDALAADRSGLPVSLVQLDDGYQRTIGDWLDTNEKFPRGIEPVARAIRDAGFEAGIWTAPFAAAAESRVLGEHPDWALRRDGAWLRGTLNPAWSRDGWVYCLDTSRDEVIRHLEEVFRALAGMGFGYQKLDFLYMASMEGEAADPTMSRAARLRRGLEAVRSGAGESAFLLGCGCPLGPAVGIVDGMRIGPDVAPSWEADARHAIPGLEPAMPSTHSALRSVLQRLFLHRRLWLNDPDCLMVRTRDTALRVHEARSLADAIAVSGGMMVFSDDVALLGADERRWVAEVRALGAELDGASPRGRARLLDPLAEDEGVRAVVADTGGVVAAAAINLGETTAPPGAALPAPVATVLREVLPAHASRLHRVETTGRTVVFCDFDGTFSVQDVGSTFAREHLSERRRDLWQRYEQGAIDAWQYAVELFDGLELSEHDLDDFLSRIELDPGARELVAWSEKQAVPLHVLSDGFDHNLERLQAMHGLRFAYHANHLAIEDGVWRLSPGGRNPDCRCGTGCCKRAQIEAWRAAHPGAWCVHVGNGRVSDLCGALVADEVFAKDTLAPALEARGVHYHAFSTLHDVVARLAGR